MYLLCCSVAFILLSIHKPHRYEWLTLSIVTFLVAVNTMLLDPNGSILYYNRAVITFIGAMFLIRRRTILGFYHAIILLIALFMYGYLAYHVANNTHDTIREFYKAMIYGLVWCQFISVFPTLRATYYRVYRDRRASMGYLQGDSRS